jgi:hypothetical protein
MRHLQQKNVNPEVRPISDRFHGKYKDTKVDMAGMQRLGKKQGSKYSAAPLDLAIEKLQLAV